MKKVLAFLVIMTYMSALDIGEQIPQIVVKNQFDKPYTLDKGLSSIIFSDTQANSGIVKEVLSKKEDDFLQKRKILYLVDINAMPSIITNLIAIPKMKKYKFFIYMLDEKDKKFFKDTKESIVIYDFENGVLKSKKSLKTKDELEAVLN